MYEVVEAQVFQRRLMNESTGVDLVVSLQFILSPMGLQLLQNIATNALV